MASPIERAVTAWMNRVGYPGSGPREAYEEDVRLVLTAAVDEAELAQVIRRHMAQYPTWGPDGLAEAICRHLTGRDDNEDHTTP